MKKSTENNLQPLIISPLCFWVFTYVTNRTLNAVVDEPLLFFSLDNLLNNWWKNTISSDLLLNGDVNCYHYRNDESFEHISWIRFQYSFLKFVYLVLLLWALFCKEIWTIIIGVRKTGPYGIDLSLILTPNNSPAEVPLSHCILLFVEREIKAIENILILR